MRSWRLDCVPDGEKKQFIIDCLSEYVDEVESMKGDGVTRIHYQEIIDTAELYKEIIRIMKV